MFLLLGCVVSGYLIGSIPTAFLLLRFLSDRDIRRLGSGNVGAMNAFEVSGSPLLGSVVLVLDILKGSLAVGALYAMTGGSESVCILSGGIAAVVGHNYPVWLSFHGGRGLSTSAGVMLVLGWIFVVVWCALWAPFYFHKKDVHLSNIAASILTLPVFFLLPHTVWSRTVASFIEPVQFLYAVGAISLLILIRHSKEIRTFIQSNTTPSL